MNKAIVIMFRNFVEQTRSMTVTPKKAEDWPVLLELKRNLAEAIKVLDTINIIGWWHTRTKDLLDREQIKITCTNRDNSYSFYLPTSAMLERLLDGIIDNLRISKIFAVDEDGIKIGDEVDEWSIDSSKPWYFYYKNMTPIARLTESDYIHEPKQMPKATKCIFDGPATIVFWDDGTKTVVKCQKEDEDEYSEEAGVALCFMKKILGNESNFNNTLNKLVDEGFER